MTISKSRRMGSRPLLWVGSLLAVGVLVGVWQWGEHAETPPPTALEESASPLPIEAPLQSSDVPASDPVEAPAKTVETLADAKDAAPTVAIAKYDETQLHATVRNVLQGDSYDDRLSAITYDMPDGLGDSDYQGLKGYLLAPQPGKGGDAFQHEYALRNYMMDALRTEEERLGETIGTFIAVYGDEAQGNVMRGYALQHLSLVYIDNVATLSTADKSRIVKTFKAALEDTSGTTLASTALVGLQDASRWDAETVSPAFVGHAAMKLLQSDTSSTLAKISAFQIGGELKLKTVGSHARKTAFDPEADWVLRMSAIYALGQLGETAGLQSLLNDNDKHVKRAAQLALKERG